MTPPGRRVVLVLATSTGGVGTHVRSLTDGLVGAGWPLTVLGPAATDALFGFRRAGAGFVPVEIAVGARPVPDALAVARLHRLLRGAQVVHAHGLRAGLLAGLACPRRTPYVVSWHNAVLGSGLRRSLLSRLERTVARRADVSLVASADLAERVRSLGGRDVRLVPVAAGALPAATRCPAEVRAELGATGRPLVLGVGRLHPQKGFDVLVRAAAGWTARTPTPLVAIAGSGPLHGALQEQIVALRAPVALLGRRGDVADLLAAADVVVLPSVWEARSLAAQEALAAGRPLVASAVGGLPELLGDAAVLVPPGDPAALGAAVAWLLDDPDAAAALAARGRARAAGWPGEADTLAQVVAAYRELTG